MIGVTADTIVALLASTTGDGNAGAVLAGLALVAVAALPPLARLARAATGVAAGLRVRDGNARAALAGLALVAIAALAPIARLARAARRLARPGLRVAGLAVSALLGEASTFPALKTRAAAVYWDAGAVLAALARSTRRVAGSLALAGRGVEVLIRRTGYGALARAGVGV